MFLNGLWNNGIERIMIHKKMKDDFIIYRFVDEKGNWVSKKKNGYAEVVLKGFIKEATNGRYKVC